MKEVVADSALVAHCGLYCGACGRYLKGKCPGCHDNAKASWCKIRTCCQQHGYATCADCEEHGNPTECAMFHNFFSRMMGVVFRSNRPACITLIRDVGVEAFAKQMAANRRQSLPR